MERDPSSDAQAETDERIENTRVIRWDKWSLNEGVSQKLLFEEKGNLKHETTEQIKKKKKNSSVVTNLSLPWQNMQL